MVDFTSDLVCMRDLKGHIFGYLVILSVCLLVEITMAWVSMRGSIINTEPRWCMQYIIYIRLCKYIYI
uniref:Uncharacterized protein n=1 Tax=Octopus bimaculoides TaxID=37653 RepID=A0A0L8G960_OCTBM